MNGYGIRPGPGRCCPEMDVEEGICTSCGHHHSGPKYVRIGDLWECRQCRVDGGYGRLGIFVHELRHHLLEGLR